MCAAHYELGLPILGLMGWYEQCPYLKSSFHDGFKHIRARILHTSTSAVVTQFYFNALEPSLFSSFYHLDICAPFYFSTLFFYSLIITSLFNQNAHSFSLPFLLPFTLLLQPLPLVVPPSFSASTLFRFSYCLSFRHLRCYIVVSMARKFIRVLPEVIPESCKWVDSDVLGAKSVVNDEFVKSFNEHYSSCVSNVEGSEYRVVAPDSEDRVCHVDLESESCIFLYEAIFTKVGIQIPFTKFEIEVLKGCEIAPSQIHPNSWGFIRGFEVICREFGFPTSLGVFHHLFKLTKPFSKEKQQCLSFRANQNMKVFEMLEESVRDFKCLYFKVVPQPGTSPFWLDGEGGHRFPLSWNEMWVDPQVGREDLSKSELLFVDTLRVMSGKSSVYDKFKAHLLNKSKKSANVEYFLGGNSRIPMDRENFIKNLEAVTKSSIKAAAICQAATNKMKGSIIVPEGEVGKLRDRVKVIEAEKRVIEGEKSELSSKVTRLEARLSLENQDPNSAREQLKKLEKEKSDVEEKYKRLYAEYKLKAELQVTQDTCDKFSSDAMLLAEEVANNLKGQIKVLFPDFDTDQIGSDHKVIDGIIVLPEPPTDEQPDP
ncbi:hypothetical protein PIB30_075397 [Stylosanthes scabra]|uniref:Transposase (putative) gypsy type domain-containing protein n=1 Tax=Stylosanthes scabra TaxID=79078 RepID=A0ABU6XRS9_9FABA|nr:hypothetical protein [Stylosanthes scabra]